MKSASIKFLKKSEHYLNGPHINLIIGITLLLASLSEVEGDISDLFSVNDIGAHHGILVLGIVHLLRSLLVFTSSLIIIIEKRNAS